VGHFPVHRLYIRKWNPEERPDAIERDNYRCLIRCLNCGNIEFLSQWTVGGIYDCGIERSDARKYTDLEENSNLQRILSISRLELRYWPTISQRGKFNGSFGSSDGLGRKVSWSWSAGVSTLSTELSAVEWSETCDKS
jgi:hypothetical protein